MDGLAARDPEPGAGRRSRWYDWRPGGTGGGAARISGAQLGALARAYLAITAFILLTDTVNVLSNLHEAARSGRLLPAWIPITTELSSAIGMLIASGLVYLAMRLAPPDRAPWRLKVPVHAVAAVILSTIHVAVMMSLRVVVFAAHGRVYRVPLPGDLLYEFRKDVVSYIIIAGIFWLFRAPGLRAEREKRLPGETPGDMTFDIVDGSKILRIPVAQILAVRADRNYVEFLLEDGRKPLMRASLAAVEAALESRGLVRTHRSWLVNPNRLRSLEATGSGDYRLGLDGGIQVPLSRRFPAALDRLRRGGTG